jgi:transcriptional regulator with XRE-family HTH domain
MGYSHHSTVARIEAGKVDVPQSRIVQFADVLNVPISYLMDWEEEMQVQPTELAERHFEMVTDEDLNDLFVDWVQLNAGQRKIIKDLAHNLAQQKTEA